MADGYVRVPPDSSGKYIDTTEKYNADNVLVERQRVEIPDEVNAGGDLLVRILAEQRVQNLLLAHAFQINDNIESLADSIIVDTSSTLTVRYVTSGDVVVAPADQVVVINKSTGSATAVTLFAANATNNTGYRLIVKDGKGDAATNHITVSPSTGQTIDGGSAATISANYGTVALVFNGVEWNVIDYTYNLSLSEDFPAGQVGIVLQNTSIVGGPTALIEVVAGSGADFAMIADHTNQLTFCETFAGSIQFRTLSSATYINFAPNAIQSLWLDPSTNFVHVGKSQSPDRLLHTEQDSAATNTVTYVERLTSTSTGTPANGIGVGTEYEVETSAGNNEVGMTIQAVTTDVTAASEDFDLVVKLMAAGAAAAEVLRVSSLGVLSLPTFTVANLPTAGTAGRRAFVTNATATTFASIVAGIGANGVPVYDDGTNWRIG